jgi:uncharacterized protein with FMN-binding domain
MRGRVKMFKKIILVLLVIIVGFGIYFVVVFSGMEEKLDAIVINPINLENIEDGTYSGEAKAGLIKVVAEVEVSDHVITNIRLIEHDNWRGGPAEQIIEDVIDNQSLEVDLISGASSSSKVILKAIENSLR